MLDLVIRGGDVVDGSGLASYRADVGIQGDRIVAIGRVGDRARSEIDAEGHVVTPGFIDGHTHMDAQVFWDQLGSCSCWHGVSTVVMGNCGFTLAPARADARELAVRSLERAEDISADAMAAGIDAKWEHYREYLDAVDLLPKGINYAGYIGHSALRTFIMGERAFEEEATEADLEEMERELEDALRAGAVGLSTSRAGAHETSDGRPVASRLASWEEVRRLVGSMASVGSSVFELAQEPVVFPDSDPALRADFFDRLRRLAVESGATVTLGVPTMSVDEHLGLLDSTAQAGGRIFGQSHSRGISVVMSFLTQLPFDRLPHWTELKALSPDEKLRALRDPDLRRKLVETAHGDDYGRAIGAEARKPDFDRMRVMEGPLPPNPTVAEKARQRGVDPVELIIDLAIETSLRQLFVQPLHTDADEVVLPILQHPRTVMTFSDSGAHVSQIMDGSIQTHLLAYWVRERQAFRLEDAVRMITLAPARAWGFSDRGLLREGMIADVNVFDPATVSPEMPTVEHDLPAGAKRLKQKATGFRATVVGGQTVHLDGEHTGALPGRLLRSKH